MEHRSLTDHEILQLKNQRCEADNWENVKVAEDFSAEYVTDTRFSGNVTLGSFGKEFTLAGGLKKHSALRNVSLHNVSVGNDCLIENVNNYIANCDIADGCFIENVDLIVAEGRSCFGNGVEVAVLNETGGREVTITDRLSSQTAYFMAMYRHRPELTKRLQQIARSYAESIASERGSIGSNVTIVNCGSLKNLRIGNGATLNGVSRLTNGSINSNAEAPVFVGNGVIADDFIMASGAHVDDGAMLTRCFVGQASHIGHGYSASDSLFFSNCQEENGEACAIFAGPYTVTHHKSTLLIAGMYSFMNAGSGSNQSNHMYKLGPIHQGVLERGSKTASDSYILWPARVGAFSLVMGHHMNNLDTSSLPFSYLIEKGGDTYIVPGVNLRSAGTVRDAQKWPKRDKRTDSTLLDSISYNLLSPYTVQKAQRGRELLNELKSVTGEPSDVYPFHGGKITNSALNKGLRYYDIAIDKFIGGALVKRLGSAEITDKEAIGRLLATTTEAGRGEWVDIAGLLAPKSEIDKLIGSIETGEVDSLDAINSRFAEIYAGYDEYEWSWCYNRITGIFGVEPAKMSVQNILYIIDRWKSVVVELDEMLCEDAEKEFSYKSLVGFGIDGSEDEQAEDFSNVRGCYEDDAFVQGVQQHIAAKSAVADELISRLKALL